MKIEISQKIFEKSSNISFHENPKSDSRVAPCATNRKTDMKKLIVAFRNFENAPKDAPIIVRCIKQPSK